MTRRDYEALAEVLFQTSASLRTVEAVADVFAKDNPRFDRDLFVSKSTDDRTLRKSPIEAAHLAASGEYDDLGKTDCPEGCIVEPDGVCPHGYESAGLTAGLV
jgi:hypothetical protein